MPEIRRHINPHTQISYLHISSSTTFGPSPGSVAVIFIHGWGCQASYFTDLMNDLANQKGQLRGDLIAIDLPGHGQSSATTYPDPTPQSFATSILELVSNLKIKRLILVGHSIGTRIVLETWRQSHYFTHSTPDRDPPKRPQDMPKVVGVVFLDGSHFRFRPPGPVISSDPPSEQERQAIQTSFSTMFSPATPVAFQASVLADLEALDSGYCRNMMHTHVAYDYHEADGVLSALRICRVPVLSIQSTDAEDGRRPLKYGESNQWMRFLREILGCENGGTLKQVLVEDAGHFPHVDQSGLVANSLRPFIHEAFQEEA